MRAGRPHESAFSMMVAFLTCYNRPLEYSPARRAHLLLAIFVKLMPLDGPGRLTLQLVLQLGAKLHLNSL